MAKYVARSCFRLLFRLQNTVFVAVWRHGCVGGTPIALDRFDRTRFELQCFLWRAPSLVEPWLLLSSLLCPFVSTGPNFLVICACAHYYKIDIVVWEVVYECTCIYLEEVHTTMGFFVHTISSYIRIKTSYWGWRYMWRNMTIYIQYLPQCSWMFRRSLQGSGRLFQY